MDEDWAFEEFKELQARRAKIGVAERELEELRKEYRRLRDQELRRLRREFAGRRKEIRNLRTKIGRWRKELAALEGKDEIRLDE